MTCRVVKKGDAAYDVYIGRPAAGQPWGYGNPFEIGRDGRRAEVIWKHGQWLRTGETFGCAAATEERRQWVLDHLADLKGKVLACWCRPLACHGDTLLDLLKERGIE